MMWVQRLMYVHRLAQTDRQQDADEADAEPVGKTTVKRTRKPTKKAAQASSDIKEEAIEEGV